MEPWHVAHLVLLAMWGGLVLGEIVIELSPRDEESLRATAAMHFWIDVFVELPLLAGILATGALLTARAWPLSTLHFVKIACALAAIGANLVCVGVVTRRHRRSGDAGALRRLRRGVFATAVVGVPLATAALYIGLAYFRR